MISQFMPSPSYKIIFPFSISNAQNAVIQPLAEIV